MEYVMPKSYVIHQVKGAVTDKREQTRHKTLQINLDSNCRNKIIDVNK